jgi:hypothetical protein
MPVRQRSKVQEMLWCSQLGTAASLYTSLNRVRLRRRLALPKRLKNSCDEWSTRLRARNNKLELNQCPISSSTNSAVTSATITLTHKNSRACERLIDRRSCTTSLRSNS